MYLKLCCWSLCGVRLPLQIQANGGTLNSATDGDMDIAFALLLAAKVATTPSVHAGNRAFYPKVAMCQCSSVSIRLGWLMAQYPEGSSLLLAFALQVWNEPKYQEEGIKVCGALLAVCYNSDTQVSNMHYC